MRNTTGEGQTGGEFYFVGNYLCLDFINTQIIRNDQIVDLLGGFDGLASWSVAAQTFNSAQAKEMLARWGGSREAANLFEGALEFRASLRDVAERIVSGRAVPQSAVDRINEAQSKHAGHVALARVRGAFVKRFHRSFDEPAHLLVPVAESASDLLSEGDLSLLRRCENPACILYFYDTTKNHARRWCSMSACGNRTKVAAYYRRSRQAEAD
ncbi:MAG: CGNR zinc finger domain-containing protein [Acidobacteriota bacterium]|nr:CGNR zinc finger domain-containing protein [Acidobacteriota bacterium]